MDKIREHLYLAALLHNIGIFYQRAMQTANNDLQLLDENIRNLTDSLLPQIKGIPVHQECLWTAQFIQQYQSVFSGFTSKESNDLATENQLPFLAAGYHRPNEVLSDLGQILKRADELSTGMSKDEKTILQEEEAKKDWKEYTQFQMVSILQFIKNGRPSTPYYIPLESLSLDKTAFASTKRQSTDYSGLWRRFEHDFKFIQADNYKAFAESFLSLLFKYTTTIPVDTVALRDVSLYDHLKMTAALAICLYDYKQSGEQADAPFLLVGADFSGIQNYIYQIVSKYASKNLKGRSFYLRLLSDTIVRYLLKELHLYQSNIIYDSGGSFYILAPNTDFTRSTLQKAIAHIEQQLFAAHGTALYVALDAVEMSEADLLHTSSEHNLSVVWKKLFEKRDKKKNGKFAQLIQNDYNSFFQPMHKGGAFQRDSITGEELNLDAKFEGGLRLNATTKEQIELGAKLKMTDFIVVSETEIKEWNTWTHVCPCHLGFHYYFITKAELEKRNQQLRHIAEKATVISLNGEKRNCDFMQQLEGINNIYSLEFYGGNSDRRMTFEDMCQMESEEAFHRLGVLRMDVDNLGSIFQSGIAPEQATLARYATLSRSFDFFFSGYLNTLQQEVAADRSSIIYSGGDDVFIVGSWDDTIRIAKRIHQDFTTYTCNNPAFSISGGIAIVADKFPIMKGAEYSAEEESRSKHHHCADTDKNSISFMQTPLHWEKEFPQVEALKNQMVELLNDGKLNKSFLSKIRKHTANADIVHHQIKHVKTYWMLTYDLSRAKKESAKDEKVKMVMDNCIKEVCHNHDYLNGTPIQTDYHPLELWAFAARWAELEIRTNKN